MTSIGICTKYKTVDNINYEKRALYEEAQKLYDEVILIDTRDVIYKFLQGAKRPEVILRHKDISTLNSLIVRSTKDREASTAILVHTLKFCGCDIFDPIERFSLGYASKLLTTLDRFSRGVGSDSFFAFNYQNAVVLLNDLEKEGRFPLVAKPIAGRRGQGVTKIRSLDQGLNYAQEFFRTAPNQDIPLFFQNLEEFTAEYRVMVVDGRPLGIVQKIQASEKIAANAAQGAQFVPVDAPHIMEFTRQKVSQEGVVGVDVAVNAQGQLRIIEANRAPLWETFEQATGISCAQVIIDRAVQRLQAKLD